MDSLEGGVDEGGVVCGDVEVSAFSFVGFFEGFFEVRVDPAAWLFKGVSVCGDGGVVAVFVEWELDPEFKGSEYAVGSGGPCEISATAVGIGEDDGTLPLGGRPGGAFHFDAEVGLGEGGLCDRFEFGEGWVFEEKVVEHVCTPVGW